MNCPKCEGRQLTPIQIAGTEVDRCEHCGGAWFDARELGALLHEERKNLKPLAGGTGRGHDARRGKCPRDGRELLRVYSARDRVTVLDTCPDCGGIWLDAGEFDALRRNPGTAD
jgi:Zn-finger nucleic acid-binding protein